MFELYTEKARRVIYFARYEASNVGSPYIETEHLLLGLLREDKVLADHFLRSSVESIRKQIDERTTIRARGSSPVDLPLSNECKRVLDYASEEAHGFSRRHVGTEHLLLGLLREEKSLAAEILQERGLRVPNIREELQRMTQENARRREQGIVAERPDIPAQLPMDQAIAADFLNVSCSKLEQMTGYLTTCVKKLTDEQIWRRQGAYENAVGNLVLHLCGNARQWIMHGVGGAPDVRVRPAEFSASGGKSGAELIALFESTMAEAKTVIAAVPATRMVERITPQGRDVSVLEAIYQVVGHVQQHGGQIILVTKQMLETDLDLTTPRPR